MLPAKISAAARPESTPSGQSAAAGVQTVIAKSFARIFYRNAINNGFYVIELPKQIEKINDGDELEIDYKNGLIKNKTAGISYQV